MRQILSVIFMICAAFAWAQQSVAILPYEAGLINIEGTVSGVDKRTNFSNEHGMLEIECEAEGIWGKSIGFKFYRGESETHENGYYFAEDSKERNHYVIENTPQSKSIYIDNVNYLTDIAIEITYVESGQVTVIYRMWADDADASSPTVHYTFSGTINNWQALQQLLQRDLPHVAQKRVLIQE